MKRLLVLLVIVSMLGSIVACTSSIGQPEVTTTAKTTTTTAGTTTTKVTTTETPPEDLFAEFMEITWLTQNNADYPDGRWDELELEEIFNVDLQVWPMDSRNREQMASLVAAGDIPDFFFMAGAPRSPVDMYKEKLVRSISVNDMKQYLPGYYEVGTTTHWVFLQLGSWQDRRIYWSDTSGHEIKYIFL